MSELRRDITEAAARMAVTFGTRSAMRDLVEELGPAEQVIELAACTYAGAAGLVALTTERVIAIRDDYSKHQVQFVVLGEVVTADYEPTVHDGFALFTPTSRLVVRKMRREDGDRLVDALLTRAPHITIQVTRPVGAPPVQPPPQLPRLGRHRKPPAVRPEEAVTARSALDAPARVAPAVAAQSSAAAAVTQAVPGLAQPAVPAPMPAAPVAAVPAPAAPGQAVPPHAAPAPAPVFAPSIPAPHPPTAAPAAAATAAPSPMQAAGTRPATDKEILLGVLADLHAQGVLTAEEFAAKVRQIVAQP